MKYEAIRLTSCFAVVTALCSVSAAQSVVVDGQTLSWDGKAQYSPLPNVVVTVTRNGNQVGQDTSMGTDARFTTSVRSGGPIDLIFHLSDEYVPVVQGVAAGSGMKHNISPALLTVSQYEELRKEEKGLPPLRERLQTIMTFLQNVPEDAPVKRDTRRLLGRLQ